MAEMTDRPEHPTKSTLSRDAWDRMGSDQRVLRGNWTELDWCWEEIRQLNALIGMQQASLDGILREVRDRAQAATDAAIFGNGYLEELPDGSVRRLDPQKVVALPANDGPKQ